MQSYVQWLRVQFYLLKLGHRDRLVQATMTDYQYYFLCFLLCFLSTILLKSLFKKSCKTSTRLNLPPSPPALPIIGHLHLLGPFLYISLQNLSSIFALALPSVLQFQQLPWPPKYLKPMTLLLQVDQVLLSVINCHMETMDFS